MRKLNTAIAGASALMLAACGSSDNADAPVAEETTAMAAPSDAVPSASAEAGAPMAAQGFVDTMAASDMFEVESSKLARSKAKDAAVKTFAAMMVTDHTKSTTELKAAAGKAAPPVTVAPKLDAEQQANLDRLKAAGDDFDALYGQMQVAGHEKALAALQAYADGGDTASLKDFAAKTAPVVTHHFDEAQKLVR